MWDNFANILRKLGEKSLWKIAIGCYVLLLARENLRLKSEKELSEKELSLQTFSLTGSK